MGIDTSKLKNLSGIIYSTQMNALKSSVEAKFHSKHGHGFAAERANNLYDNLTGKNAKIVGDDNLKNGADRLVNGVNIQSKYFSSGSKCINQCFDGGKFKYYNPDGSPMQIEVPADKYNDAIKAMQSRIDKGQIHGVERAEDIVRAGNVTYEQAKNIAKAGTIDSLIYDAVDGVRIAGYAGGISAAITFAVSMWNGKNFEDALKDSIKSGLQTGGVSWASSILVGQMTKAGANSLLVSGSESLVEKFQGYAIKKASANMTESFLASRLGATTSGLLRGNIIAGVTTVFVMSSVDVVNIFRGRISAKQLFKNVVNTSAGVAGGIGGAVTGAAIGSVVPVVGTAIGGFVGGFIGGTAAGKVSLTVTDKLIEDDSKAMIQILEDEFQNVAFDYLLNENETKKVVNKLGDKLDESKLRDMYAAKNRYKFARNLIEDCTESVVTIRQKIYLPTIKDYTDEFYKVFGGRPVTKGQKVELTKNNPNLKEILVNLGYDKNSGSNLDLDVSIFLLNEKGKVNSDDDFIFYNNLKHKSGSVEILGGQIKIFLDKIPADIEKIDFAITIYDAETRRQNFSQVSNTFISVATTDVKELIRYDLDEDFSVETAVILGEIYRYKNEWKFNAIGNGFQGGLASLCEKFGINID